MSQILTFLDIFYADTVKMNLNSKNTLKTSVGGFLTILSAIFISILSWFIGKDLFLKSNPFYHQQSLKYNAYQNFTL
jgi:hypothetical protein